MKRKQIILYPILTHCQIMICDILAKSYLGEYS
jgi:hypothetical protein